MKERKEEIGKMREKGRSIRQPFIFIRVLSPIDQRCNKKSKILYRSKEIVFFEGPSRLLSDVDIR